MSKPSSLAKMILRPPVNKMNKLHPDAKKKINRMTQTPKPLKYEM